MTPPSLGQEEVALGSGGGEFELGLTLASQKTSHSGQNQKKLLSRQFLLAYAVAQTTLVSGVVYGWPALRKALKDNNVAGPNRLLHKETRMMHNDALIFKHLIDV